MAIFKKIENLKEWQELLDKALFQTFFHCLEWETFLEQNFKWLKFERYLWNGQVLLSLARYELGKQEKLISHPFCEYGGPLPLAQNLNGNEFTKDLFDFFKLPVKISLHPAILNYFNDLPAKESRRSAFWLEGFSNTSKEQAWHNLRKTTRHEIQNAKEKGYKIVVCKTKIELVDFYKIYLATAKVHMVPAYPFAFFENWLANSQAEIILAKKNNRIVAGSVFLKYHGFLHYFLNASKKSQTNGANHLLLWTAIEKNVASNFTTFDLGGTKKGSALSIFKQGFGNVDKPIMELTNYPDRYGIKSRFSLGRRVWGTLPIFVIKFLSPRLLRYKL